MSGTVWAKFFWADWLSDVNLRRCSPAARGLWMDMLCFAAQAEPFGHVAEGDAPLPVEDIADLARVNLGTAKRLIAELERRRVFSRDDKGRIFSRRLLRDAAAIARLRKNGSKGGNPSLINGGARCLDNQADNQTDIQAVIPQKPESRIQSPIAGAVSPIARAARVMGVPEGQLRRRSGWMIFGDMMAGLLADGCEVERDVWPTIERIGKRMSEPPASPLYFRAAILDARDRRLSGGGPHAAGLLEWEDRLAVYAAEGAWSSRWGPKPGEAGCLAPDAA